MNVALVHGPRLFACAATLWLLSLPDASAQFSLPDTAAPATTPAPAVDSALSQGQNWVTQTRTALARRDYVTAVRSYRQLAPLGSKAPQLASDIAKLRLDLQLAGIDSQLLTIPPPSVPQSPAPPAAAVTAPVPSATAPVQAGVPSYAAAPPDNQPTSRRCSRSCRQRRSTQPRQLN